MTDSAPMDDDLLREVLKRVELTTSEPTQQPDEETLALFVAGQLNVQQQQQVLRAIDADPKLRELVAQLMQAPLASEIAPVTLDDSTVSLSSTWGRNLVLAAVVLIAVGIGWWTVSAPGEQRIYEQSLALLENQEFGRAREVVLDARSQSFDSTRLRNIEGQAWLEIDSEVSLDRFGTLPDFGYAIDGVVARAAASDAMSGRLQEAAQAIADVTEADNTIQLNRGFILIRQNRGEDALRHFRQMADTDAADARVWNGLGIAAWMLSDFETSEAAFRSGLEQQPGDVSLQVNLAMSLTELGRFEDALAVWQAILNDVPPSLRSQVEEQVEALSAAVRLP